MTAAVRPVLVLTDVEAQLILDFRTSDAQSKHSIKGLAQKLAAKFPEHQRPILTLVRGAS